MRSIKLARICDRCVRLACVHSARGTRHLTHPHTRRTPRQVSSIALLLTSRVGHAHVRMANARERKHKRNGEEARKGITHDPSQTARPRAQPQGRRAVPKAAGVFLRPNTGRSAAHRTGPSFDQWRSVINNTQDRPKTRVPGDGDEANMNPPTAPAHAAPMEMNE